MIIYLETILSACYLFPFLALFITLPYVFVQYKRYGAVLVIRTAIIYTFAFYMLTSFFMTLLPMPAIDSVTENSAHPILIPFDAWVRSFKSSGFTMDRPLSIFRIFLTTDFLQIFFNILLLVPFGVYLRYYFQKKWYWVLALSFAYSLFFEVTQLTGIYGIYPHAYRFFEVDDLIDNTCGGMVGYAITPLLAKFLPTREQMDTVAFKKGERVSILRRIIALVIDYIIFEVISNMVFARLVLQIEYKWYMTPILFVLLFTFINIVTAGRSIGKWIVNIRIVNKKTEKMANIFAYLIRNIILQGIVLQIPNYLELIMYSRIDQITAATDAVNKGVSIRLFDTIKSIPVLIGVLVLLLILNATVIDALFCYVGKRHEMLYDTLLGLKVVNSPKKKFHKDSNVDKEAENI